MTPNRQNVFATNEKMVLKKATNCIQLCNLYKVYIPFGLEKAMIKKNKVNNKCHKIYHHLMKNNNYSLSAPMLANLFVSSALMAVKLDI